MTPKHRIDGGGVRKRFDCGECGCPAPNHNAHCSVSIHARLLDIKGLRRALKPFANIGLLRDWDAKGEDMIDAPDLAITPRQVRAARKALQNTVSP